MRGPLGALPAEPMPSVPISSLSEYTPDTCVLSALMSVWHKCRLLTGLLHVNEHLSVSVLLYNPYAIHIMFICSSATKMYAHKGDFVLFTAVALNFDKLPVNNRHPIHSCQRDII